MLGVTTTIKKILDTFRTVINILPAVYFLKRSVIFINLGFVLLDSLVWSKFTFSLFNKITSLHPLFTFSRFRKVLLVLRLKGIMWFFLYLRALTTSSSTSSWIWPQYLVYLTTTFLNNEISSILSSFKLGGVPFKLQPYRELISLFLAFIQQGFM